MVFRQLGNGGAFDPENGNSAFIFNLGDSYLLFDCGYTVFQKLRSLSKEDSFDFKSLKYVWISHMDDDHMGSLKTLIYYMYFVHRTKLIIMCGQKVFPLLESYLSDIDGFIDGGCKIEEKLFILRSVSTGASLDNNVYISPIENFHFKPSYGLKIDARTDGINQSVIISSDGIPKMDGPLSYVADIIFHDFSYWNQSDKQVHMCFDTIPFPYRSNQDDSLHQYQRIFPYHDDKPFAEFWGTVEDYKRLPRFEQFHKEVEDWWVNKKGLKCKWLETKV